MAKSAQTKIVTKKHLARQQREQMQTRYIIIASAVVLISILVLVVGGLFYQLVYLPSQPVVKVYEESFGIDDFQKSVRYQRLRIIENYINLSQYFGEDANFQQQLATTLSDHETIGQNSLDGLIEEALVRREAQSRAITVNKEEIDHSIQDAFGFFPNGTPTPEATLELLPTATRSALQQTLVPATATLAPTEVLPTATASVEITPTATATPFTESAFNDVFKNRLDSYKEQTGMSEADFRRIFENVLLRERLMENVLSEMDLSQEEEQVWARHILVSDPVTATLVLQELQNGADFSELAQQYSEDTSNAARGGDLGWFGQGQMAAEFEAAAWPMEIGQITPEAVQTSSGYHIIQVLGHEMRPLSESAYQQLRQETFQTWLSERRIEGEEAGKIIIFDRWLDVIPNEPNIQF